MSVTPQSNLSGARQRLSVIGLDYGTHSTKVVQRYWGETLGRVICCDQPCEGHPSHASPSMVSELVGRLYFGTTAVGMKGAEEYGSLKAELMEDLADDPDVAEKIEILAVAYVAWVLKQIIDRNPSWANDKKQVQISAPTSFVGNPAMESKYNRIGHAAYALSVEGHGEIDQGIRYEDAVRLIRPFLSMVPPAKEDRKFSIQPETIAPIISLKQEPIAAAGMYLMIDMGAGTTEMSVIAVSRNPGDPIRCYYDSTERRGGSTLAELETLPVGQSQRRLERFLAEVQKQASKVWHAGFVKDSQNRTARRNWQRLTVLLTGGATRHPSVPNQFDADKEATFSWQLNGTKHQLGRHHPRTLRPADGLSDEDLSLFAVANGLSIHAAQWQKCFVMDDIANLLPLHETQPLMRSYLELV